jgi:hypothetical protein
MPTKLYLKLAVELKVQCPRALAAAWKLHYGAYTDANKYDIIEYLPKWNRSRVLGMRVGAAMAGGKKERKRHYHVSSSACIVFCFKIKIPVLLGCFLSKENVTLLAAAYAVFPYNIGEDMQAHAGRFLDTNINAYTLLHPNLRSARP